MTEKLERKNTGWVSSVTALPVTIVSIIALTVGFDTATPLAILGLVAPLYTPFLAVLAVRSKQWLAKQGVDTGSYRGV